MSKITALYSENPGKSQEQVEVILSKVTITIIQGTQQKHWLLENVVLKPEYGRLEVQHPAEGILIISDDKVIQQIQKSYQLYKRTNWGIPVVYMSIALRIIGFFAIIGLIIYLFFRSVVPWMGEKAAESFPKEYEIQLGEEMFAGMKSSLKIDTAKSAQLQAFYNELGFKVDYPVQLYWVDEPVVNAFAIPGGNVVVYRGIVEKMQRAEELAALLAHEVSHIAFKHSLKGIFRKASNSLWWMIITGGDAGIVGALANQADMLQGLSYGRELESEADKNGVVMMFSSGIDTRGMLDLVNILKREEGDKQAVNFLSTHPIPEIRIQQVEKLMQEYPGSVTVKKEALDSLFKTFRQSW
jgi:predicted Zn-dependent protease